MNEILAQCQCGQQLMAPPGQQVQCPACQMMLQIPHPSPAPPATSTVSQQSLSHRGTQPGEPAHGGAAHQLPPAHSPYSGPPSASGQTPQAVPHPQAGLQPQPALQPQGVHDPAMVGTAQAAGWSRSTLLGILLGAGCLLLLFLAFVFMNAKRILDTDEKVAGQSPKEITGNGNPNPGNDKQQANRPPGKKQPDTGANRQAPNPGSGHSTDADSVYGPPPIDPSDPPEKLIASAPLSLPGDNLRLISGESRPFAVISQSSRPGKPSRNNESPYLIYDLLNETIVGNPLVNNQGKICAVSKTGKRFVILRSGYALVLDVFLTAATDKTEATLEIDKNGRADLVYFEDDQHLIVASGNRLQRWSLPDGKKVFEERCGTIQGTTPGGNFLLESGPNRLHFRKRENLKRVGTFTPFQKGGLGRQLAISPDGRKIARYVFNPMHMSSVMHQQLKGRKDHNSVYVCDLASGKRLFSAPVPPDHVPRIRWIDNEYLACGSRVISIAQQAYVARAHQWESLVQGPGQTLWRKKSISGRLAIWPGKAEEMEPQLNTAGPLAPPLIQPADAIELSIRFRTQPPVDWQSKLEKSFRDSFQKSGFREGQGQRKRLEIVVEDLNSGETFEIMKFTEQKTAGPFRKKENVKLQRLPEKILRVTCNLTANGEPL
ncbi:MAG: hypothetical protein VX768_18035 [Planctomycetota bacterium]|nr:hypothetical protein [Planctomycetota bacterium]